MPVRRYEGPPAVDEEATVIGQHPVAPGYQRLRLRADRIARDVAPGQFVMVRAGERHDPLLRRPMSIAGADPASGTIEMLYRVTGVGTSLLAGRHAGDKLPVLGPLGRPFELPPAGTILLVGGGIGMPPLCFAATRLPPARTLVIQGARTEALLLCRESLAALGVGHRYATEDGSAGVRGLVTDLLGQVLCDIASPVEILACGPMAMLMAVARMARERAIRCQVSVEERMACGFGICMGCAMRLARSTETPEYALVCVDGPVFEGTDIV